ncbi:heavy metal translocating P-type ATPase [Candidatus Magnetoovum chiemensis]|nr:heavy metal translocating P-type ATPase [Candidatus Magnetoovum chiemensis]
MYIYALWEAVYFIGKKKLLTSKQNFRQSLHNLFETSDDRITIIVNNQEISIPISEIKKGDIVSVKTGEVIPADGFIENGIALIDQKYLTGEAQPVEKMKGSAIYASTHVVSGTIHIRVEETGQETIIKKVDHILNHSIDCKLDMLSRGEKLMEQATVPIFIAGSIALPLKGFTGSSAVYGSTPGYDLVLFAPLAMLRYIDLASKHGLFVKDARAIEMFSKIDTFIFDKTGTLTHDHLEVGEIFCFENFREDEILFYASLAEQNMSHPIAQAITAKASQHRLLIPRIDQAQYKIGFGVSVNYENKNILVGSKRFMLNEKIDIPDDMDASLIRMSEGHSLVYIAINDQLIGIIEIRSSIREEAKRVVRFLSENKTRDIMIMSGDQENPTKKTAMEMDIDTFYFEVLPENKAEIIKELQKKGKKICFIGDGINDTLAMKQADLSISLCNNNKIAAHLLIILVFPEPISAIPFVSQRRPK